MKKVIATLLLTVSMSAHSVEPTFSNEQMENLQYAYAFGEQFQKNGKYKENPHQHNGLGYIMAGLTWQESSAGVNTGLNKDKHHAYGIFQNYLPTVRERVKESVHTLSPGEVAIEVNRLPGSPVLLGAAAFAAQSVLADPGKLIQEAAVSQEISSAPLELAAQ